MKLAKAEENVATWKFDKLAINSLILSMWHAYNSYNFEVYIKWVGILSKTKGKNRVKFAV